MHMGALSKGPVQKTMVIRDYSAFELLGLERLLKNLESLTAWLKRLGSKGWMSAMEVVFIFPGDEDYIVCVNTRTLVITA